MYSESHCQKVRNISEGNLHSCYASNKAEKFKFRRLSLGLESCALAQSLKLRREEKILQKSLVTLTKEKEKHLYQREINRFHSAHRNSNQSLQSASRKGDQDTYPAQQVECQTNSSGRETIHSSASNSRQRQNDLLHRKYPSDYHMVTPFYLQHDYKQYHNDAFYDTLGDKTSSTKVTSKQHDNDEPSWTTISPLALYRRRQTLPPNAKLFAETKNSDTTIRDSSLSTLDLPYDVNSLNNVSPPEGSSVNELTNSIPTSLLEQRLSTPAQKNKSEKHRSKGSVQFSNLSSSEDLEKATLYQSLPLSAKVLSLKKLLLKKMKEGESIEVLVEDPAFDNILEIFDELQRHSIHTSNEDFAEFRALRNCKYLRLSDLNNKSLKQNALEELCNLQIGTER